MPLVVWRAIMVAPHVPHLRGVLRDYVEYYNTARCHQALEGNAPEPREIENGVGAVRAIPLLGGLHHRYSRVA